MQTTRRKLMQFAGGSAVGALMTPAPWRLITDTALWSENWPGIPRPAAGEIRVRYTNCSLCAAGCAVKARCVADEPVSLAGVKAHPLSQGALCPWGIAAHHLPYHPARLRKGPVGEAATGLREAIAHCGPKEQVAVLDLRPGRTASWTYRRAMAAIPNGVYIARPPADFGFDLRAARTVLSLGAPLADGWGTPGNVFAARSGFRLIQADAVETRTAIFADEWIPVRAGSEGVLAFVIAGEMSTAEAAAATGLPESKVRDIIAELRASAAPLVVADEISPEVMRANAALGAIGKTVWVREQAPVPAAWKKAVPVTALEQIPDRLLRVLMIDEAAAREHIPWIEIAPKLASDALVVSFGWTADGYGKHARFTLPAPVWPEGLEDVGAAPDHVMPVFRVCGGLAAVPDGVVNPPEFVARAAGIEPGSALQERAEEIRRAGKGTVFTPADGKSAAVKEMSADEFWKALQAGACWIGERAPDQRHTPAGVPAQQAIALLPQTGGLAVVVGESAGPGPGSPLESKLYRESNLRQAADRVALAPATARASGLADGARAWLEIAGERRSVVVSLDPGLPADIVKVAARDVGKGLRGKVVPA